MSITALHIPHDARPLETVVVDERNALTYYPFVSGGPVEGGYLSIGGWDFVAYVNSRYMQMDESAVNARASELFEMSGAGMAGGSVRGDALLVLGAGEGEYERSIPRPIVAAFLGAND